MSFRLAAAFSVAWLAAACGAAAPKPLPGGPPPEYEPARGYDGGGIDEGPAEPPGAAEPPAAPPAAGSPPATAP
jgi:hypothetical protein